MLENCEKINCLKLWPWVVHICTVGSKLIKFYIFLVYQTYHIKNIIMWTVVACPYIVSSNFTYTLIEIFALFNHRISVIKSSEIRIRIYCQKLWHKYFKFANSHLEHKKLHHMSYGKHKTYKIHIFINIWNYVII